MGTTPGTVIGDIQWYEQRVSEWIENAVAIGISAANATDMQTETTEARGAYDAVLAIRTASKLATENQTAQVKDMRTLGSQLIKSIRAYAITQPNPNVVYQLANVPPQSTSTPAPPETPHTISSTLTSQGEVQLKWKGNSNGGGTVYAVSRAVQADPIDPIGSFEQIGLTGSRTFIDASVPACTINAQYIIKAYKGTYQPQVSDTFTVRFTAGSDSDVQQFRYVA